MALQEGERYRCTKPGCVCEIQVIQGPQGDAAGDQEPRCCCGQEMEKV